MRDSLAELVLRRDRDRRHRARRRPARSISATCRRRARRSSSRSRSACCPRPSSASTRASRSARREPEVADEQIEQEIEAMRERLARLETAERPAARRATSSSIDYVGSLARRGRPLRRARQPFAGGEGRDQLVELGAGNLIPGFEEGLLGRRRGETRTVALTFPADYGNERSRRPRGVVRDHRQGGQAQAAARARRRLRDRRRLRQRRGAARGHPRPAAARPSEQRIEGEFRQAALDAAVAAGDRSRHPRADRGARAGDVGADAALALPPRASRARPTCRSPAARSGDPRRDAARRRAGAAPRGRARARSSPPRASARPRRSCSRRWRRRPSARASSRRSCSRICAAPGAWRRCARISPRARPSS